MMDNLLTRLETWLGENRPDYLAILQPGLSPDQLDDFERNLGVALPEGLRALYRWRDGQAPGEWSALQFNRMFASSAEVLDSKQTLDELAAAGEFEGASWWSPGWIPFLPNGGGDYLCCDTVGSFDGRPGQLLLFWHDWDDRSIEYSSVERWLEILVASLEAGLWEDQDGDLHPVDDDDFEEYHKAHDPGYPIKRKAG